MIPSDVKVSLAILAPELKLLHVNIDPLSILRSVLAVDELLPVLDLNMLETLILALTA
jgi:hypothetical protein